MASLLAFFSVGVRSFAQEPSADQPQYFEITKMKVKQDKVAEFGQMAARVADANRRGKGDTWIAMMDFYGTDNHIWMASARPSLAEPEAAMGKFMGAIKEFMGYSPDRFVAETSKLLDSSGTELWHQRTDLSWNIKDMADWSAHLAKARYLAVMTLKSKPGHSMEVGELIRMVKDAAVAHGDTNSVAVAQVVMGGDPGTFYVRIPLESVPALEKMTSVRSVLGEEGYRKYSEMAAQDFASLDYALKRMVPEWSNPPASFVEANPKMWKAKPVTVGKPKATSAEAKTSSGS